MKLYFIYCVSHPSKFHLVYICIQQRLCTLPGGNLNISSPGWVLRIIQLAAPQWLIALSLSLFRSFFLPSFMHFSPYTWADYYLAKGSECPYTDFWSSLHSALLSSALCPQIWLPFGLHDLFGFLPLVRRFSPETAPRLSWCYWRVCLVFSSLLRVVVLYCLLPETAIVSYNLFCLIFCIYNGSKGHFIGVSPSWIEVKVEIKPFAQSQTRKKSGKNPISRT